MFATVNSNSNTDSLLDHCFRYRQRLLLHSLLSAQHFIFGALLYAELSDELFWPLYFHILSTNDSLTLVLGLYGKGSAKSELIQISALLEQGL